MSNLQPTGPAQLALQLHPALHHHGSSSASHGLTQPKVHNHYLAPSVLLNLYGLKPGHGVQCSASLSYDKLMNFDTWSPGNSQKYANVLSVVIKEFQSC